jgi:Lysyl oxidase
LSLHPARLWREDDVNRLTARLLGLALVGALAALASLAGAASAADRMPDLGMAKPSDVRIQKTSDGRRLLRYTAVIANVGAGALELQGSRSSTSVPEMSVSQRIFDTAGGSRVVPTSARMHFAGDGHNHWHVGDLETGVLTRLDNGVKVGTLAKHGFCFYDTSPYRLSLPGAPQSARYTGCGTTASALAVTMGLSVGWSDVYPWGIAFQYIDVTALTAGRYRLTVGVNNALGLLESSRANNSTWVDLQLKPNSVRVLAGGPSI